MATVIKPQVQNQPRDPFDDFVLPPEELPAQAAAVAPVIPHSREAEEAVIGACLINPDVYHDVAEFLRAEDFYIHRHQWIWDAFRTCLDFDRPIDFLTVCEVLDGVGKLADLGGPAYMTSLINQVPLSSNAVVYGRIVEAHSVRRKMIAKANAIASLAYDESVQIEDALARYDKLVDPGELSYSSDSTTVDSDDAARDLLEVVRSGVPTGVMTGFPHFDKPEGLGGLPDPGITLMIGDSSFGKSAWWLQVCEQVAEHFEKKALYCGLEAHNRMNVLRRVSGQAGVLGKKLRSGQLTDEEKENLETAIEMYLGRFGGRLKFNSSAVTLRDLEREIRLHRPDLVVIDQINQIDERFSDNKTVDMLHVFTGLKGLSSKYECAMGVVHAIDPAESRKFFAKNEKAQAGKKQKNSIPDLNSIPWAKQIKHVTDVMLMLVPEANQKLVGASILKETIWVMKDRDGNRFTPSLWEYDLALQWFNDLGFPKERSPMAPSSEPVKLFD